MSVEIIINNKPIRVYTHENKNYVEGRKGSEFSIRIKNPYGKKILAIPSVDGLSTLSGEPASSDSSGYVIQPYGEITIPGWKLDNSEVAKFEFSDSSKSYAATSDNADTSNVGVIGVMFVEEKYKPVLTTGVWYNSISDKFTKGIRGVGPSFGSTEINYLSASPFQLCASGSVATPEPEEKLGTGFGKASEFRTREVDFERGDILSTISIFYDSKQNLIKKGVIPLKEEKEPNPFPGTGCKPPKSWSR